MFPPKLKTIFTNVAIDNVDMLISCYRQFKNNRHILRVVLSLLNSNGLDEIAACIGVN